MSEDAPEREELREALLLATLPHVPFDGWGQKALMAGARDAGVAPPLALNAFPGGATEMIEYFNSWADRRAVAALEGARHGIAFASGSAATVAIAQFAVAGEEIVVGDDVYGGTYRYFERVHRASGVGTRYVDLASGADTLWEALNGGTSLVWFETPTNPLLKVIDIAAAAEVVGSLQHIVSRRIDPLEPAVVTIGSLHGGDAPNVIPGHAELTGTTRCFDPAVRERFPQLIEEIARGVCAAHGAECVLDWTPGYLPVVNDERATALVRWHAGRTARCSAR